MVIMKGLYKRKDKSQFYGVRRVIPARLRHLMGDKVELKESLGTADYNEALSKAPAVWLRFENAIAKAERQLKAELSFTDKDIESIANQWTSHVMPQEELIKERYLIDDYEYGLIRSPGIERICDILEELDRQESSEQAGHVNDEALSKLMALELQEAQEWSSIELPPFWRNRLARRLAERSNDLTNVFIFSLYPKRLAEAKGLSSLPEAKAPQKTFTQLFEAYKEFKCPSDAETIDKKALAHVKDYAAAADRFVEINGNPKLDDITADHIVKFRDTLAKYPKNLTKKERALTLSQKLALQNKGHLTPDRVRNMLNHLSSFFEHAIYVNWLKHNVVRDVRKPARTARDNSDKPFTSQELTLIFSGPVFSGQSAPYEDMDYWVPIILYYTGCRVEEVAQLHKRDIQHRDGVLCMKLQENETQSIKTGKTRYVPVPLHVLELGFSEFVSRRNGFLFSDKALAEQKYSTNFAKRFSRYIRNNGIERDEISPTHSFRHTFITNCRRAGIAMDIRDSITGHISPQQNESGNYGDKPVETKLAAIESIPKLNLHRIKDWSR
ncbi:site-specific integrase [Enterobacter cloacae]|uniref:site-specific integrase n=1 Tax=Enterobacter cloacae TaxID=550 RepID=UPI0020769C17|nr:site-specific integrase [Enterobacter cloacae]MCM7453725.1 site-specific integrase [Enterobacter cloacae]